MKGFARAGIGAAATLCVVLVPVGLVLAGYQVGGYAGTTDQGEPITFRAADDRVKRLSTVAYADCGNGTRQKITVESGRTRIGDEGRFSLTLTGASALEVTVTGRFRGGDAAGKFRATVQPSGTSCVTEMRWRAIPKSSAGS